MEKISLLINVLSRSVVFDFFVTPRTVTCQAPLSMGFPRQEYWSGLPFPSPGDLPVLGIEPESPALPGRLFKAEPPGRPHRYVLCRVKRLKKMQTNKKIQSIHLVVILTPFVFQENVSTFISSLFFGFFFFFCNYSHICFISFS